MLIGSSVDLVSIVDKNEANFVGSSVIAAATTAQSAPSPLALPPTWIGFNDRQSEQDFVWSDDDRVVCGSATTGLDIIWAKDDFDNVQVGANVNHDKCELLCSKYASHHRFEGACMSYGNRCDFARGGHICTQEDVDAGIIDDCDANGNDWKQWQCIMVPMPGSAAAVNAAAAAAYTNWASNAEGYSDYSDQEDCVFMAKMSSVEHGSEMNWLDASCDISLFEGMPIGYVCKAPLGSLLGAPSHEGDAGDVSHSEVEISFQWVRTGKATVEVAYGECGAVEHKNVKCTLGSVMQNVFIAPRERTGKLMEWKGSNSKIHYNDIVADFAGARGYKATMSEDATVVTVTGMVSCVGDQIVSVEVDVYTCLEDSATKTSIIYAGSGNTYALGSNHIGCPMLCYDVGPSDCNWGNPITSPQTWYQWYQPGTVQVDRNGGGDWCQGCVYGCDNIASGQDKDGCIASCGEALHGTGRGCRDWCTKVTLAGAEGNEDTDAVADTADDDAVDNDADGASLWGSLEAATSCSHWLTAAILPAVVPIGAAFNVPFVPLSSGAMPNGFYPIDPDGPDGKQLLFLCGAHIPWVHITLTKLTKALDH